MAEINVTPLVDVMLVLLIIFMVTAPLLTSGVPIDLPDSRANPLDQDARPGDNRRSTRARFVYIDDDARAARRSLPRVGWRSSTARRPTRRCHAARRPRARLRAGDGGDGRTQPRRMQQHLAGHQRFIRSAIAGGKMASIRPSSPGGKGSVSALPWSPHIALVGGLLFWHAQHVASDHPAGRPDDRQPGDDVSLESTAPDPSDAAQAAVAPELAPVPEPLPAPMTVEIPPPPEQAIAKKSPNPPKSQGDHRAQAGGQADRDLAQQAGAEIDQQEGHRQPHRQRFPQGRERPGERQQGFAADLDVTESMGIEMLADLFVDIVWVLVRNESKIDIYRRGRWQQRLVALSNIAGSKAGDVARWSEQKLLQWASTPDTPPRNWSTPRSFFCASSFQPACSKSPRSRSLGRRIAS